MTVKLTRFVKLSSLVALTLFPIATHAQSLIEKSANSPIKIICLGDSLTVGYRGTPGEGGYRGALAQKLTAAACQFQFVGRRTDNSSLLPLTDQAHEGFQGYTIEPFAGKNGLYDDSQIGNPVNDITIYHPDVVIVLAGTDNINLGQTPAAAVAQYDDLLKRALVIAPDADIIVGAIPLNALSPQKDSAVLAFNTGLKNLVDELQNRNYKIHFVSGTALPKAMLAGGLYPAQSGYDRIADQWFGMIGRL